MEQYRPDENEAHRGIVRSITNVVKSLGYKAIEAVDGRMNDKDDIERRLVQEQEAEEDLDELRIIDIYSRASVEKYQNMAWAMTLAREICQSIEGDPYISVEEEVLALKIFLHEGLGGATIEDLELSPKHQAILSKLI